MKVFLDTNVLIAAFVARGLCEDVLRLVLAEHELATGAPVLTELERVLSTKLKMPKTQVSTMVRFIREQAQVTRPKAPAPLPESAPDDQWVLAAALDARADMLVTGDSDLLNIADQLDITILSPREFWEQLKT